MVKLFCLGSREFCGTQEGSFSNLPNPIGITRLNKEHLFRKVLNFFKVLKEKLFLHHHSFSLPTTTAIFFNPFQVQQPHANMHARSIPPSPETLRLILQLFIVTCSLQNNTTPSLTSA